MDGNGYLGSIVRQESSPKGIPSQLAGRCFLGIGLNVQSNHLKDALDPEEDIKYVNDYHSRQSYVACEVVRQDGVPYQYQGESIMNVEDSTQNLFVLHTKIQNSKI